MKTITQIGKHDIEHIMTCIADFFGTQDWEYDHDCKRDVLYWLEDTSTDKELTDFLSFIS